MRRTECRDKQKHEESCQRPALHLATSIVHAVQHPTDLQTPQPMTHVQVLQGSVGMLPIRRETGDRLRDLRRIACTELRDAEAA